jgi:16S rRNA (uracil1498-N3)-methyltransferase
MPASRFFIDADLSENDSLCLEGSEYHHLLHVMRHEKGEKVELVNGQGDLGIGHILELTKKHAVLKILEKTHQSDLSRRFLLAVPFMRMSKLEWIVEKGTELGASAFLFYRAQYCECEDIFPRQMERLRALTIGALKQSGRLHLPSIERLPDLTSLFIQDAVFLFGAPSAVHPLDLSRPGKTILFITDLNRHGQGICLGPHILRAETAPITAASVLGIWLLPTSSVGFEPTT